MTDSGSISQPDDSVKAPAHQINPWFSTKKKRLISTRIVYVERANTIKVAKREATWPMRKNHKPLKIKAKKKNKANGKESLNSMEGKDQLMEQPPVPVTLEEYMSENGLE